MDATNMPSLSDIAAVTKDDNGLGNGGAWWIIILFIFLFGMGGAGWGGNGAAAATAEDIQRAVDLNSIQQGQATIAADIQRGIYEVNGATKDVAYNNLSEIRDVQAANAAGFANVNAGLSNLSSQMATCCCTTQRAIDGVNYNLANASAAIQANDTANTQKILDALCQSKTEALQAQINQLQLQAALGNVVRYPSATTYTAGYNPYINGYGGTTF